MTAWADTIVWLPLAPWWAMAVLSALAGAVVLLTARGGACRRGHVLLLSGFGALLVITANPVWLERSAEGVASSNPHLAVVVDTSGSMRTADVAGRSRLEVAREIVHTIAAGVNTRGEDPMAAPGAPAGTTAETETGSQGKAVVSFWSVARDVQPMAGAEVLDGLPTMGDAVTDTHASRAMSATHLDAALSAWMSAWLSAGPFSEGRPNAVVLLSDGHDTQRQRTDTLDRLAAIAREADVPIWTVMLGTTNAPPRWRVEEVMPPRGLRVGQRGMLGVRVRRTASCPDEVRLRMVAADEDAGTGNTGSESAVVVERSFQPGETNAVWEIPIGPFVAARRDAGMGVVEHRVRIETAPPKGASTLRPAPRLAGGPLDVFIPVMAQPLNIVWLQGEADWDSRFAALALADRSDVRLSILTLTIPTVADAVANVLEGWLEGRVDVLVLGAGASRMVSGLSSGGASGNVWARLRRQIEAGRLSVLLFDADGDADGGGENDESGAALALRGLGVAVASAGDVTAADQGDAYWDNVGFAWTAAGRRHPLGLALFGDVADGASLWNGHTLGAMAWPRDGMVLARVEAQAGSRAALAEQRLGRGRLLALTIDDLWRWRFPAPNAVAASSTKSTGHENAGENANEDALTKRGWAFDAFWTNLFLYLGQGEPFVGTSGWSIAFERPLARIGERVSFEVRRQGGGGQEAAGQEGTGHGAADQAPTTGLAVFWTRPDGSRERVSLAGPWVTRSGGDAAAICLVGTLQPTTAGVHTMEVWETDARRSGAVATARIVVRDDGIEWFDVSARPAAMEALATTTGGKTLDVSAAPWSTLHDRIRAADLARHRVRRARDQQPLLMRWWVLLGCVSLLCGGWALEYRGRVIVRDVEGTA